MRKQFEDFISILANIPFIRQSIEFQIFINQSRQSEQNDTEEKLKKLKSEATFEQLKYRYTETFCIFIQKQPLNEDELSKYMKFKQFLKLNWLKLDLLCSTLEKLHQNYLMQTSGFYLLTKSVLNNHNQLMHSDAKEIISSEQIITGQGQAPLELSFVTSNESEENKEAEQKKEKDAFDFNLIQKSDVFDGFLQAFQRERMELNSLYRAITYIETLEQEKAKLSNKITGKAFTIKKHTPEEEKKFRQDFDYLNIITQLLQRIYVDYYIDNVRFYKEKKEFYYFVINRLAERQLENLAKIKEYHLDLAECFQ